MLIKHGVSECNRAANCRSEDVKLTSFKMSAGYVYRLFEGLDPRLIVHKHAGVILMESAAFQQEKLP